jgi:signal transduction histidine kinase
MGEAARRSWQATVHVITGLVVGLVSFTVVLIVGTLAIVGVATVVGAPSGLAALFGTGRALSAWQRSRFASLLEVHLDPLPPPPSGPPWLRQVLLEARTPGPWRQLGYHLLAGPFGLAGSVLIVSLWSIALVAVFLITFGWSVSPRMPFNVSPYHPIVVVIEVALIPLLAVAASRLARSIAGLDIAIARALLEPSRAEVLAKRVEVLSESRADVVDAADAERRRIERDLHDGAQQRLVALSMNLGLARATLPDYIDPRARDAIAQAHDEAKLAMAELRDLVRGLHPAVLDDRGLDAALSGVAARSPLPVRVQVDLPSRPSRTIEAVAYFVVSEALSNVAKHAEATRAEVTVRRSGPTLRIEVLDDGRGGADPTGGTGLRGLAQRVGSVDGTLVVDSPVGGPTLIAVELPCES